MSLQSHPAVGIFLAAALLSPAFSAGDSCQPLENCHLSRWVPPGNQNLDQTGGSVAIHGDSAAVGSPGAALVHLYERVDDVWSYSGTLADPAGSDTFFGFSLSMSADFLVVGAPYDETFGAGNGAAHVYQRVGDAWVHDVTLYDETPTLGGWYGYSVSVDGPWMGVGAPNDSALGRVHIYIRTFTQWEFLLENGFWADGAYGHSVFVKEYETQLSAHLFVGDPENDSAGNNAGAVTHIQVNPGGTAGSVPYTPPGVSAGDHFGTSLGFADNRLVVGAPYDSDYAPGAGAAYVLDMEPEVQFPEFTVDEKLLPCGDAEDARFGRSVDVDGSKIAVGARNQDSLEDTGGRVYVFGPWFIPGVWELEHLLVPGDGVDGDLFGTDVAVHADEVLVGAVGVGGLSGASYMFSIANEIAGGQCPCDALAATALYGEGKPGTLGIPEIGAGKFIPGETTLLGLENLLVGVAPLLMWGTIPTAIPMDEGTLLIADPRLVVMPVSVIGQIGVQFVVPDHPALCGFDVYFQALFLDPGAEGEYHTAQSRGLRATIGY